VKELACHTRAARFLRKEPRAFKPREYVQHLIILIFCFWNMGSFAEAVDRKSRS